MKKHFYSFFFFYNWSLKKELYKQTKLQATCNRSTRRLRLWQTAGRGRKGSSGGSRTGGSAASFAGRASLRRWFRWVVASEPSPWRCRSPGRWPLCRFRSCREGKWFRSEIRALTHTHTRVWDIHACRQTYFWRSDPFCRPGWFCLAKKNEVHQWPESCLGSPAESSGRVSSVRSSSCRESKDRIWCRGRTWVVGNDLACVFSTATGAAAGGRTKASWQKDTAFS